MKSAKRVLIKANLGLGTGYGCRRGKLTKNDEKASIDVIYHIKIFHYGRADMAHIKYYLKAETIYKLLIKNHIDVLFDDTDEHLSAKFKKFDLIGIPYQIILGSKSSNDKYEFKEVNNKTETLSLEEIKNKLTNKRNLN